MSLDVIYHLTEDETYVAYLQTLFSTSRNLVLIYSTDFEDTKSKGHVRHRKFSKYVANNFAHFNLILQEKNQFRPRRFQAKSASLETSAADFFLFKRLD